MSDQKCPNCGSDDRNKHYWVDAGGTCNHIWHSRLAPTREVEPAKKSLAETINSLWTGEELLPCGCPANSEYLCYNSETKHAHCIKCGDPYRHESQIAASPEPQPQQQAEGQPTEEIPKAQTFEEWWDEAKYLVPIWRNNRVAKDIAREAWAAAKGGR